MASSVPSVGLVVRSDLTPDDQCRVARAAEEAGCTSIWLQESPSSPYAGGIFARAATLLGATTTITVATGIVPIVGRHPVMIAGEAQQLYLASNGRFLLGLGVGSRQAAVRLGVQWAPPLLAIKEAAEICRALFRGGIRAYEGQVYRVHDTRLRRTSEDGGPPIWIAAIGHRMLELAEAVADGALLSEWSTVDFVREARRRVTGRSVASLLLCGVGPDRQLARAQLSADLTSECRRLAGNPHFVRLLRMGRVIDGDQPPEVVDEALLDAVAASGNAEDLSARVDAYRSAGADTVVLSCPGVERAGPYFYESLRAMAGP